MKPTIGNWYRILGGDSFEIVAFDEDDGTIERAEPAIQAADLNCWTDFSHSAIRFQLAKVRATTLRSRLPRERELRVASHAKGVHRSGAAAKVDD